MNVNQKIWLGFGPVLALVGIGATLGYRNSQAAERASVQLVRESRAAYTSAASAEELNAQASVLQSAVGDLLALVGSPRAAATADTVEAPPSAPRTSHPAAPATADAHA